MFVELASLLPCTLLLRRFFHEMSSKDALIESGFVEASAVSERARSLRRRRHLSFSIERCARRPLRLCRRPLM